MRNNTCPPCLTAAAGTELPGAFKLTNIIIFVNKKVYDHLLIDLLPLRDIAGSNFRSLPNIPHCSLLGAWAVSQSQCGCTPVKANLAFLAFNKNPKTK
jgi:hypothetical protein|tara:strand:- start:95 stop:388 length:294 start_codon:yes stop_codon:yes gene_type:complete